MYFALMGKLNARRKGLLAEDEKGFTLIELLVVVIIIGILAAIAIPVYLNIQNNAKDSAAKSDLESVKTAIVAYETDHAGDTDTTAAYPTSLDQLASYGFKAKSGSTTSVDLTTAPTAAAPGFCVDAVSASSHKFHITDSDPVAKDDCASVAGAGSDPSPTD